MPGSPLSVLAVGVNSDVCSVGPVYSVKAAVALRSDLAAGGWKTTAVEVSAAIARHGVIGRHLSARHAREAIETARIVKGGNS